MDSRPRICANKCEGCPFVSCNFNPVFLDLIIAKRRGEAAYSVHDSFAWADAEMANEGVSVKGPVSNPPEL